MKILYVYGDDDYAALTWEDEIPKEDKLKLIEEAEQTGDIIEFQEGCYIEILIFNDIDPVFVAFVKNNIQDCDESKHTNFYLEPYVN